MISRERVIRLTGYLMNSSRLRALIQRVRLTDTYLYPRLSRPIWTSPSLAQSGLVRMGGIQLSNLLSRYFFKFQGSLAPCLKLFAQNAA